MYVKETNNSIDNIFYQRLNFYLILKVVRIKN